ncbi:GNAT family N-acetyltransferase [Thermocoleostomius sinensis]|uniref:GNAT family N-acetyltransferase n=1 Tax=Thermocoleostomius sinensis A174 TaxID=2016057 RepID=A0A9E9C5S7_9CYAN|nr:GNAT family N-acetyltransferase [Thermocoleostomius sinensis]WAL58504.1 GNAT family N-acetyltransferase [Thermocoleostomius sinensis A174]
MFSHDRQIITFIKALSLFPLPQRWEPLPPLKLPFFVRTVRHTDLFHLAELLAQSFHRQEGVLGWLYPVLRVGIYEDLRTRLQAPKRYYTCLVAVLPIGASLNGTYSTSADLTETHQIVKEASDRIIGTVEISLRRPSLNPFCRNRYLYLSNLAVQEEYRRQGVAQQLLQTSERVASDWGFHDLYLHVLENNHRARRLYWKAGYRLKSIDANPLGWVLGRPRQLLLHKPLAQNQLP